MRETPFGLAIALAVILAAPVGAQDPVTIAGVKLGYDSVRLQEGNKTLEVKSDGTWVLDKGGKRQTGTLTPNEFYEIATGAAKANFSDGKKLGTEGTPFTITATGNGSTLTASGFEGMASLETFHSLVYSMSDFAYEKTRWFPGFSLFKPKLPNALEMTLQQDGKASTEITIFDNGMVKITQDGRTLETTLTQAESDALAKAVRTVDRTGTAGDVSWNSQPTDTRFKIITYETFRQYLLTGSVGNYGNNAEVGGVLVAVDTMLDRVARERAAASGNMFTDMLDDLGKTFDRMRASGAAASSAPSRTSGIDGALILDDRTKDAKDRTRGGDAAER